MPRPRRIAWVLMLAWVLLPARGWSQEQPAPSGDQASRTEVTAGQAPAERTAEEQELSEMLSIVRDFQQQTLEYKKEVQLIVERKFEERRDTVVNSYERVLARLEREESTYRDDAIAVFERFLANYPDNQKYTPGALWRLAELHYERAKLELARQEDSYEQELAAFNRGESKVEPAPPAAHFERTVELLQRLLGGFPGYNLSDGATYLLAYCLQEQGEADEAADVWQSFARRYPDSKLLPEVWTRLGELYFDDPDKLNEAAAAYAKVLAYPDSPMYDKALYKLAWAYYRVDRFDEAVQRFDQLITWADRSDQGKDADLARSELRKEALQYLAISFTEEEWANGGVQHAIAFFEADKQRTYADEFFRKLGEVYQVEAKFDESIQAFNEAVRRAPLHPDNPKLMSSVIESYHRLQRPDDATRAQEQMVTMFAPGTRWWQVNQDNLEAITEANKLAENALYASAVRHHTLAQRLKEQAHPEEAQHEYAAAALAYSDYLKRFPQSRDTYRLTYYLAESYYYSLQFDKAAENYTQVRDSSLSTEFLAEAANSVILSVEHMIKAAEKEGQLEPLKITTSKDRPADSKIAPQQIPALRKRLIAACDAYVEKLPEDKLADNWAFRAAQIFYAYDQFDEARERFSSLVSRTAKDDVASSSINLIIESYLITQDWPQVETWSRKLAALTRDPQLKKSLKTFELGARFNKATVFMSKGQEMLKAANPDEANKSLDLAAEEFIRLVDDDPKGENADKALNNAALCYTWSQRPISAGKVYERIVREYPKSEFADQALFLMAGSAEASYQFQRAIDNYLQLVERYPDSRFRADAMFNAAVALEGDQQYAPAARNYERYARLFPDRPDASENFFRAGLVLEKQKDYQGVVALYTRFIQAYRRNRGEREHLVRAQMKIAEALDGMGDRRRALKAYQEVVQQYRTNGLSAGGRGAEAAAKAAFLLAEQALTQYEAITFDVPTSRLKKTLNYKAVSLKKMEDRYKQVFEYKRVQWTLAAYFRLGYLYENFADVLTNAPCPRGLNQEECDIYKGRLMDYAEAPIKKAVAAYVDTMDKSRSFKVVNDWTQKALESLNRFEPLQFPLQKQPEAALVMERFGPQPLLQVVDSGVKPSGK